MKFFWNPDSPLMRLLSVIAELVILNLLWVLCCIPVVTAGAATTGLYRSCLAMARGNEDKLWRLFFREFRGSFGRSSALWGILLGTLAFLAADYTILSRWNIPGQALLMGLLLLGVLVWLVTAAYVFPLTAQFDNTIGRTIKNAWIFGFGRPLASLLIVCLNLLPVIMYLLSPTVFLRFFIFWLLLGFAVVAYVNSMLFTKIFAPYTETACE